jgi:hypothetical protein
MLIPSLPVISIFNTSPPNPQVAPDNGEAEDVFTLFVFTVAVFIKACRSRTCPCILPTKAANDSNWSRCDSVIVCADASGAANKIKPAHIKIPHTVVVEYIFICFYF